MVNNISKEIIKDFCSEIDFSIEKKVVTNKLIEIIYIVIKDFTGYSQKFINMLLDVHNDVDGFRASYIVNHKDYDLQRKEEIIMPDWLINSLKEIKQNNIEFWI